MLRRRLIPIWLGNHPSVQMAFGQAGESIDVIWTLIEGGDVAEAFAATIDKIVAILNRDLFDGFQAIG